MMNKCILISGPTIALDIGLTGQLQKITTVLTNIDNSKVESIAARTKIDLILLEIEDETRLELEVIKNIKLLYPETEIVIIHDERNRDVMAKAFEYGASDAFRKPYKITLIVGRIKALLRNQKK